MEKSTVSDPIECFPKIYKYLTYIFLSIALKGAMSQETGLEVPRCWPQYKRMLLVRAIYMFIDIDSFGALPTVHVVVVVVVVLFVLRRQVNRQNGLLKDSLQVD